MLEPAILHKDEIQLILARTWDVKKYKYYHIGYNAAAEIDTDEWNKIQRAIIDDKLCIGYLHANVNRTHGIITNLGAISVADNYRRYKIVERDLLSFFLLLMDKYPTIQWSVCYDNPVRKKYEKFVQHVGGNIIGVFHNCCRIGLELRDEEMFEIFSTPESISKVKELKERLCSVQNVEENT